MELGVFNSGDAKAKAKRYISYDLYYDRPQNLSLEDDVYDLENFKSKNKFVVIVPCAGGTLAWNYRLVGHLVRNPRYTLASEVGKIATLSLIRDVEENFAAGHCFARFDASNVVLTHTGQVLLKHVGIINPSYQARKDNLEDLYNLTKGFFGKDLPADVDHLLKMMENKTFPRLYTIHTSLVPHTNKGWAFIQMYEYVKRKLNRVDRERILLQLPYHDNWRSLVQCNSVLAETYGFSKGSYDPSTGNKSAVDRQLESAELLLDFIRNGLSHRLQRSLITNAWQFDLIALVLFPLLLPHLQKAILEVMGDQGHEVLQAIFRPLM